MTDESKLPDPMSVGVASATFDPALGRLYTVHDLHAYVAALAAALQSSGREGMVNAPPAADGMVVDGITRHLEKWRRIARNDRRDGEDFAANRVESFADDLAEVMVEGDGQDALDALAEIAESLGCACTLDDMLHAIDALRGSR